MKWLLALFIFCFACGSSEQQDAQQDPYLGVMWQSAMKTGSCDWLQIFNDVEHVNLSFLWGSYGSDSTCLHQLFNTARPIVLRAYLSNGVCIRKRNCSALEIESIGEIIQALGEVQAVAAHCASCVLEIVPQLEDNWTHNQACAVYNALRGRTDASIIRNPVKQSQVNYDSSCFDGIELHNELPERRQRTSGSNDGAGLLLSRYDFSGVSIDVAEAIRRRKLFGRDSHYFLWHPLGNCLHGDTAQAPFPYLRNCEDRPDILQDLNDILRGVHP